MPRWAYWVMWVVVIACLLLIAAGCASVTGPCAVDFTHAASAVMQVRCEAGGSALIISPARAIEAIQGDSQ